MLRRCRDHWKSKHLSHKDPEILTHQPTISSALVSLGASAAYYNPGHAHNYRARNFAGLSFCHGLRQRFLTIEGISCSIRAVIDCPVEIAKSGGWVTEPMYIPRDPLPSMAGSKSNYVPKVPANPSMGTVRCE